MDGLLGLRVDRLIVDLVLRVPLLGELVASLVVVLVGAAVGAEEPPLVLLGVSLILGEHLGLVLAEDVIVEAFRPLVEHVVLPSLPRASRRFEVLLELEVPIDHLKDGLLHVVDDSILSSSLVFVLKK